MTLDRRFPSKITNPGGQTGALYAAEVKEEGEALWNRVVNIVGTIGGTGNAITGVCTPPLTAVPINGQVFILTPGAANTTAVTVNLDGFGAIDLRTRNNSALASGDLATTDPIAFRYDSSISKYRLLYDTAAQIAAKNTVAIAVASTWEQIGDTTIAGGESEILFNFTPGLYCKLNVIGQKISFAGGATLTDILLRTAAGVVLMTSQFTQTGAANFGFFDEEIILNCNLFNTYSHFATLEGCLNTTPFAKTNYSVNSGSTAAGQVRIIPHSADTFDSGRAFLHGLRA